MKKFQRVTALTLAMLLALFQGPLAQAAMITTDAALQTQQQHLDRSQVLEMLDRQDVQQQLIDMGVDMDAAKDRVEQMTPAEISLLNDKMSELPAGEGVLGVILVIFIVFVITDVIGATDIFSFIHPVR